MMPTMHKGSSKRKPALVQASSLFEMAPQVKFSSGGNMSDIDVFVPKTGTWETVATVYSICQLDAEDLADFITKSVVHYAQHLTQNKNGQQ